MRNKSITKQMVREYLEECFYEIKRMLCTRDCDGISRYTERTFISSAWQSMNEPLVPRKYRVIMMEDKDFTIYLEGNFDGKGVYLPRIVENAIWSPDLIAELPSGEKIKRNSSQDDSFYLLIFVTCTINDAERKMEENNARN
mgnify:FL=1